jgi:pimeloyl-ACP methyl ester carboxylesterase
LNPGGPGGSGVFLALLTAHDSQFVADSPIDPSDPASFAAKAKYFDIIGFDPRGVNNTTPRAYCFPDDVTATLFALEDQASGFVNSNESFVKAWARTSAMAQSCNERIEGVAEFVGTRTVVEDMRAIVDALGEWRSNQKGGLDKSTMPEHKEKVLFWGFSYGTLLGATFATVYPNRIERMILDGVVDAEDYYSGTSNTYVVKILLILHDSYLAIKSHGRRFHSREVL